jgi:hypothetical protein
VLAPDIVPARCGLSQSDAFIAANYKQRWAIQGGCCETNTRASCDVAHIHCAVGASDKCNKVHLLRHALKMSGVNGLCTAVNRRGLERALLYIKEYMQVTASKMITVNEGVEQLCEDAAHIHCAVEASDKCSACTRR